MLGGLILWFIISFTSGLARSRENDLPGTIDILTCHHLDGLSSFLRLLSPNARDGFVFTTALSTIVDGAMRSWQNYGASFNQPRPLASIWTANAIMGKKDDKRSDYCFSIHLLATFLSGRWLHLGPDYSEGTEVPETPVPSSVLSRMQNTFLGVVTMVGQNRQLDLIRLVGIPFGATEAMQTYDIVSRTCPEMLQLMQLDTDELRAVMLNKGPSAESIQCTAAQLEQNLRSGLRQVAGPVRPNPSLSFSSVQDEIVSRVRREYGNCLDIAENGGSPCHVAVSYVGLHESLLSEVTFMFSNMSKLFRFEVSRMDPEAVYDPGGQLSGRHVSSHKVEEWSVDSITVGVAAEAVVDMSSIAIHVGHYVEVAVKKYHDAVVFLCTIPAFGCALFSALPYPVIMYAANPATAQIPLAGYSSWLALLVKMASDPKNHILVSNTFAQAQYEYQTGVVLPVIRVHGLYTRTKRPPIPAGMDLSLKHLLIYDRTGPLFARTLQALRARIADSEKNDKGEVQSARTTNIKHHLETDRKYDTFATFDAVMFMPGDVEQMAFYEFYSMELPLFVPGWPGLYMKPWLLGMRGPDVSCGAYSNWAGSWAVTQEKDASQEMLYINCRGHVIHQFLRVDGSTGPAAEGHLRPLPAMDEKTFTHCLQGPAAAGDHVRIRLSYSMMEIARISGTVGCTGSFRDAQRSTKAVVVYRSFERQAGGREMSIPYTWGHTIFGSTAWYLEARLPHAPRRVQHSPFRICNVAAAREWAEYMDFFRFPAVGIFESGAELLSMVGSETLSLHKRQRVMRSFNAVTLERSLRQWRGVVSDAVLSQSPKRQHLG